MTRHGHFSRTNEPQGTSVVVASVFVHDEQDLLKYCRLMDGEIHEQSNQNQLKRLHQKADQCEEQILLKIPVVFYK